MTWRVIVGTLSLVITMILLGYVAVTETDRMANFGTGYGSRQVEVGAALFESNCASCHGPTGQGGAGPALNTPDLLPAPGQTVLPKRMAEVGWSGSAENYIRLTIAAGRPRPSVGMEDYSGVRMPTWSQEFGGPLRTDQVDALVAFVMNWGNAFQAGAGGGPPIQGVGTDISAELPAGDAANGETLATNLGCAGCHIAAPTGPAWLASADPSRQGIGTRAAARVTATDYSGSATDAHGYLFESIVLPDAYIVPGNPAYVNASNGQSIMPHNYGQTLDAQMTADLIAYLETLK